MLKTGSGIISDSDRGLKSIVSQKVSPSEKL